MRIGPYAKVLLSSLYFLITTICCQNMKNNCQTVKQVLNKNKNKFWYKLYVIAWQ